VSGVIPGKVVSSKPPGLNILQSSCSGGQVVDQAKCLGVTRQSKRSEGMWSAVARSPTIVVS
jgi:hypothetical protein